MTSPLSIREGIGRRFKVLTLLLLSATTCTALATQHWFFELFSHFKPHYALFALLSATGLLLAAREWRWSALALLLALWNGYPVARALLQPTAPADVSRHVTVFHLNVGLNHEQPARISAFLRRRAKLIDVVVLLETTSQFDPILGDIIDIYPYQIKHLENSAVGIAIASRFPLEGRVSGEPSALFPHIEAAIKLPGRETPLALFALHAPPPITGAMAAIRNSKLNYVAQQAAALPQATPLVVGNFSLTPWSPYFQKFAVDSGLRDARLPRRFDHTWPVTFDNANLGAALDHSFAHPSLPLLKRDIGPDLGSDHMPVTVTFGY